MMKWWLIKIIFKLKYWKVLSWEESVKNILIDMKIYVKNYIVCYWEKCIYLEFRNDVEFGCVLFIECIIFFND